MQIRFLFVTFFLAFAAGCSNGNDVNSATLTASRLDTISLIIIAMHEDGIECGKLRTIDDFIKRSDDTQMISKKDIATHRLEQDAWGNPFHWRLQSEAEAITISVISNGQDGVLQNGKGDDISLVVTIPHRGKPKVQLIRPNTIIGH